MVKKMRLLNLNIMIVFSFSGTLLLINIIIEGIKIDRIVNQINNGTFFTPDNSGIYKHLNLNERGKLDTRNSKERQKDTSLTEALKNGDARFFPSDALLDNYTLLNIDNFGMNLSSKDVKLKTLFVNDMNYVPITVVNDITTINYTINCATRLTYQYQEFRRSIHTNSSSSYKEKTILMLTIVVISSPNHFQQRNLIRKTWGDYLAKKYGRNSEKRRENEHLFISLVFLMGLPINTNEIEMTTNIYIQNKIIKESKYYDDVVQFNAFDQYYRLTDKSVTMLHWLYTHCPQTTFSLKCDDDVYINLDNLVSAINAINKQKIQEPYSPLNLHRSINNRIKPSIYGSELNERTNSVQRLPGNDTYLT